MHLSSLALRAPTRLNPDEALKIIKEATGKVKGGGASLLTSGLQNVDAEVHIEKERPGQLELSIDSGKRILELCTFSADATANGSVTKLRVGGLETYKTTQSTTFFIPTGPKTIAGMAPYKRFLEAIELGLRAADVTAQVSIAQSA